jgi:hypothetical protein
MFFLLVVGHLCKKKSRYLYIIGKEREEYSAFGNGNASMIL